MDSAPSNRQFSNGSPAPSSAADAFSAARDDAEQYDTASRQTSGPDFVAATLLSLGTVLSVLLLGFGLFLVGKGSDDWSLLAAGATTTLMSLLVLGLARVVRRSGRESADIERQLAESLRPVQLSVESTSRTLKNIENNTLLSERGKQVAFRDRDRDAIRLAIEEDLLQGDFSSARQLVDEFERGFGYKDEADRFREQIRNRLSDHRQHEIEDATASIDRLCREEKWADAMQHAERLIGQYGGDMQVRLVRTRIEQQRQQQKVELVKQFHDARYRNDHDQASDLLRRLDTYLTPEEGRQLSESAREVFKGKLINLRDRFMSAMHRHEFSEALRIGEIIKREFPNSQLAAEVRDHEPQVREAAGVAPSEDSPL